ncbi:TIGR03619 family F420-dependent LLM class oxidoreductase [Nonomuraea sp. NPDC049152]|uniref:TIGR03619 family F420-dependent LLM class oxidoreductase n=1 Tax=Nonomuraea sp. NPDC049152 TaxID=3154350 RepID=UPI0033C7A141
MPHAPADGRVAGGGTRVGATEGMRMKFGISYNTAYYGVDPDKMMAFAQHAEDCGFESLYVPEHIVLYPGATVGPVELPPSLPFADPLDCLSFIAAATRRILLGTGVLLLPYHHPVVLAKRLATVDVLSKGRMRLLTVGLGSLPGEARAVGVDFGSRGRRADEAIDVMRLLWAGGEDGVSFEGEFFTFDDLCSFPKPLGVAHLPIHVGGSSRAAARRAGRRGDGYFPGGALDPAERAVQMELARSAAIEAGRDPETLEYTRWGSIGMSAERVEAFAAQGVTRVVVSPTTTELDWQRDEMSSFAQRFALLDPLPR